MKNSLTKNYQNFMIFFTFFFFWFSIQFGKVVEDSVAYILVISLGIFHGANDLLILSKVENDKKAVRNNILIYIGILLFCVLVYMFQSYIAILLFIILSAYHFGEEHFSDKIQIGNIFNGVYYLVYGILLFSMLFYESQLDVETIMIELTNNSFTELQIKNTFLIAVILFLILNLYLFFKKKKDLFFFGTELFYLGLLFLVFKTSSLILSFAIYFILWHSIPSIIHQIEFLSGFFNKKNSIYYLKKGLIYWVLSIVSLLVIYIFFTKINVFASIVFVILFAVTAPHTWVMFKMKSK